VSAQSEQERHWVGVRQRQCRDASSEKIWRDSGFVRIGATTTVRHVANGDEYEKKMHVSCASPAECSMK